MNRHAWLQKHPSPQATRGEFHWYPDASSAGDRELRVGFVERVRGLEPPAVLWRFEPGRAAWAQVFSATAPCDGRRYVGLVLSVVEGDWPTEDLLGALSPPAPAPWTHPAPIEQRDGLRGAGGGAFPVGPAIGIRELVVPRPVRGDVAGVARALMTGGSARVDDPTSPELLPWIASIERLLPEPGPRPRCGAWKAGDGAGRKARRGVDERREASGGGSSAGAAEGTAARGADRVAALVEAAWRDPGSRAARAWELLCELALARRESVDQVGAALDAFDPASALTAAERASLARCDSVVDVLHAWGRGRLDQSQTASTLTVRLADLVALRVVTQLAAGGDAAGPLAEARWYALLPAQRRAALLAAVALRTASLRALVEVHHA